MEQLKSTLPNMNVDEKTVFLRADLNVPLHNGIIANDFKIQAERPTIDLLLQKNAKIVLATHLGRPQVQEKSLSTKNLMPWFKDHGYAIEFAKDPHEAANKIKSINKTIVLLENLRFFSGEKDQSESFAQELKHCGQFYVNDAFGTLHRDDTSITLVPQLYAQQNKTIGLLIEKELHHLNKLIDNPMRPFMVILGGGKVETKLSFIENMIKKVDKLLLCPALVFTLLKALGNPIGKSLVDNAQLENMKKVWAIPNAQKVIALPSDYQVVLDSYNGPIEYTGTETFPNNAIGTAIGPKTITDFGLMLKKAKTIFFNATMGFSDYPETQEATKLLLKILATTDAYTVVGGGDSVKAVFEASVAKKISFLSTGGGATLAYISGEMLPGLKFM